MIVRLWQGSTCWHDADEYLDYLKATGLAGYAETAGNLGYQVMRRRREDRAEFLVASYWHSFESIEQFAGEDIDRALFYPEDERFLVERDPSVDHFEVVAEVPLRVTSGARE